MRTPKNTGALRLGLLWVDATTGVPLITGISITSVAVLVGASASSRVLLAGLADPLNFALSACGYLGPAVAASAAAHLGWQARSGVAAIAETAPHGRWRTWTLAATSSLLWAVFAYLALLTVVLLTVDLNGPRSWGMAVLAVQGLVLVIGCTLIGAAIGFGFTAPWIPPLVALALFAAIFYLDRTSGSLDRFSPIYSGVFYQVNLVPNTHLLAGVITGLAAVTLTAVLAARLDPPQHLTIVLAGVSVALFTAGTVLINTAPARDVAFRQGGTPECFSEGAVTLCVFAESAPQLRPMTHALARVHTAASPLYDVPTDFFQPDVTDVDRGPSAVPVDIPPNIEKGGQLSRAVDAIVPGTSCTEVSALNDRYDMTGLIFERIDPGSTVPGEVDDLALQTATVQKAWLKPRLARLTAC